MSGPVSSPTRSTAVTRQRCGGESRGAIRASPRAAAPRRSPRGRGSGPPSTSTPTTRRSPSICHEPPGRLSIHERRRAEHDPLGPRVQVAPARRAAPTSPPLTWIRVDGCSSCKAATTSTLRPGSSNARSMSTTWSHEAPAATKDSGGGQRFAAERVDRHRSRRREARQPSRGRRRSRGSPRSPWARSLSARARARRRRCRSRRARRAGRAVRGAPRAGPRNVSTR